MISRLIFGLLLVVTCSVQAQYTVVDGDDNTIDDGDVITFGSFDTEEASLDFFVNNDTSDDINVKIEFVSAVNADGSEFELCFGLCYTDITLGASYPFGSGNWVTIAGDGQSPVGNHFFNQSSGGGNLVEYVFRFYMVDGSGTDIGNSKSFTYRYDPALSVNDNSLAEVKIASSAINDVLRVQTPEDLTVAIYSLLGQKVLQEQLSAGTQQVNVGHLASQAYVAVFTNAYGNSRSIKIIKN